MLLARNAVIFAVRYGGKRVVGHGDTMMGVDAETLANEGITMARDWEIAELLAHESGR